MLIYQQTGIQIKFFEQNKEAIPGDYIVMPFLYYVLDEFSGKKGSIRTLPEGLVISKSHTGMPAPFSYTSEEGMHFIL